ncbi:MAG: 16S rRNA (cytosine(967)-C(5))-methyltransferase RsmB [bacterium]
MKPPYSAGRGPRAGAPKGPRPGGPRLDGPRREGPRRDGPPGPRRDGPRREAPRPDPRPAPGGGARATALEVLAALEDDNAFLQPAVDGALRRAHLSRVDQALVRELVAGTTRWQARLDHALDQHARKGMDQTPVPIRRVLRLAAYQILFLDRIPDHAAVDAAVDQARFLGGEPMARLCNAVLRKLSQHGDQPPRGDEPGALAARLSQPRWLVLRWLAEGGPALAARRGAACNRPAPLTIRPDRARLEPEILLNRLQAEGATVVRGTYAPEALHLEDHPDPFGSDSFGDGWWRVQDEAAQLVGHLLDPQPGETVWDVCAAPGGKTRHLARLMQGEGRLLATDTHPGKADRLAQTLRDLECVRVQQHDGTVPLDGPPPFDRVLVDAPCSGFGVLRRHPELKWRRTPEDIGRLAELQARILDAAALGVRPGGVLVYSVCTDTPEEGPRQAEAFLERNPLFTRDDPPAGAIDWAP